MLSTALNTEMNVRKCALQVDLGEGDGVGAGAAAGVGQLVPEGVGFRQLACAKVDLHGT